MIARPLLATVKTSREQSFNKESWRAVPTLALKIGQLQFPSKPISLVTGPASWRFLLCSVVYGHKSSTRAQLSRLQLFMHQFRCGCPKA
jgi:hypothetical protein